MQAVIQFTGIWCKSVAPAVILGFAPIALMAIFALTGIGKVNLTLVVFQLSLIAVATAIRGSSKQLSISDSRRALSSLNSVFALFFVIFILINTPDAQIPNSAKLVKYILIVAACLGIVIGIFRGYTAFRRGFR